MRETRFDIFYKIYKKALLLTIIILFIHIGNSLIVQGNIVFNTQQRDIFSNSLNSTEKHLYCGKIHNLSKSENMSLYFFYSNNMRELYYWKSEDGNFAIAYFRLVNEYLYIVPYDNFRGIITQRFIFGCTTYYF